MKELVDFEQEIDISSSATNEELLIVIKFIEDYFDNQNISKIQLENCKKLSLFLKDKNIIIEELESEILLNKSPKLNIMFKIISDEMLLPVINDYKNLICLLDIYCQKNRVNQMNILEENQNMTDEDIDLFKLYLKEIGQYRLLSVEEERELASLSQNGDINARNKLIEHNLRLVIPVAKRYQGVSLSLVELVLFGNEGIIIAADKFDPKRECRFSTYATWWIRQAMQKGMREAGSAIVLPSHIYEYIIKVKRIINKYMFDNNGNIPSEQYIAEKLDITISKLRYILKNMEPIVSLSTPVGDEYKDGTLEDMIVDEQSMVEEIVENIGQAKLVETLLNSKKLKEREREVIKMRFGFYGEEMKLEEIGKYFGLSRERIRQIESDGLKKILKEAKALNLEIDSNKKILSFAKTK